MNDNEREDTIRTSIKAMREKGIGITSQTWGISFSNSKEIWAPSTKPGACCPMACVLLYHQEKLRYTASGKSFTVQDILNTNSIWISSFQKGFDGYDPPIDNEGFSYELGILMRKEFINN